MGKLAILKWHVHISKPIHVYQALHYLRSPGWIKSSDSFHTTLRPQLGVGARRCLLYNWRLARTSVRGFASTAWMAWPSAALLNNNVSHLPWLCYTSQWFTWPWWKHLRANQQPCPGSRQQDEDSFCEHHVGSSSCCSSWMPQTWDTRISRDAIW